MYKDNSAIDPPFPCCMRDTPISPAHNFHYTYKHYPRQTMQRVCQLRGVPLQTNATPSTLHLNRNCCVLLHLIQQTLFTDLRVDFWIRPPSLKLSQQIFPCVTFNCFLYVSVRQLAAYTRAQASSVRYTKIQLSILNEHFAGSFAACTAAERAYLLDRSMPDPRDDSRLNARLRQYQLLPAYSPGGGRSGSLIGLPQSEGASASIPPTATPSSPRLRGAARFPLCAERMSPAGRRERDALEALPSPCRFSKDASPVARPPREFAATAEAFAVES